jgi:uncharacterized protein YfiM (DUF2279 family)
MARSILRRASRARLFLALLALVALGVALDPAPAGAESISLPPERTDSWWGSDKSLHFAGSLALVASLRVTGRDEGSAVGWTIGAGVAKEMFDAAFKRPRKGRGASWKDLVVDLGGAAAGLLLIRAVDR